MHRNTFGRLKTRGQRCWSVWRHLAGETGHLRSFSPAICRLQPVRQAPPRGGGDSYWQPAVPPVMAGQRPAVHRSERRWAYFCYERCIEGCLKDALWDLQDWSTAVTVWQICPNCLRYLQYIYICMMIWHLLLYSVQTKQKWCISSMMCSWKLLKCIVKRCIWCEIKFCGKKNVDQSANIFLSAISVMHDRIVSIHVTWK